MGENKITIRAFVLGIVFCAIFAALTVYFSNRRGLYISSTQIPVLPYVLLFIAVLVVNPVCRLIRVVRPFSAAEILIVFTMGVISAGVSTFGLSAQVVPVIGNLFNEHWNSQSEWNRYIEPFIDEQFFVAEPGIREAAAAYNKALTDLEGKRAVYDCAAELAKAEERLVAAEAALRQVRSSTEDESEKAAKVRRAEMMQTAANESYQKALSPWKRTVAKDENLKALPLEKALDRYSVLIKKHEAMVLEQLEALRELETRAFEKVNQFRRGLPIELRAFPGIFPTVDDTFASYVARLRRFWHGRRALNDVKAAYTADSTAALQGSLDAAVSSLLLVDNSKEIESETKDLSRQLEIIRNKTVQCEATLKDLHEQSRFAAPGEKKVLGKQISRLNSEKKRLQRQQKMLTGDLENTEREVEITKRIASAIDELSALRDELTTPARISSRLVRQRLAHVMRQFPAFDVSLRRVFLGDVPWSVWIPPLLRWGVLIALTYVVLMAFNLLIFRQWAHNEKLIYPLAQLPEDLAGADNAQEGIMPFVFRSGLFWIGAGISGGVLGWNLLCATHAIPGLEAIDLIHSWTSFIQNSPLQGLAPRARSSIFFTMIGLSFLIPQKISFSLWFFSLLYMIQLLVIVGLGYGVNESSFPADWWYTMNFRTAEGTGALLVFSLVVLYKCRKYIMCFFFPSSVSEFEGAEQKELRTSSFLFIFGSMGIVLILWLGMRANFGYAVFCYVVILLITIGLIRAVTEGGILGFQAWSGPFHLIRSLFGMDKSWTAPSLFSPLVFYHAVFFLDIKTFIAPAMANSIKIRDDLKMKRGHFHLAIFSAIVIAVVVAIASEIMMGYSSGADKMDGWFHSTFPRMLFDQVVSMSKSPPSALRSGQLWVTAGGVLMAALLYFRQTCFWLPHPLGFIMLVNPIMNAYWFSILLGWIAKSLVIKYGNKDTYAKARYFFIGLIAGELILVTLAMIFSIVLNMNIRIDLNRSL